MSVPYMAGAIGTGWLLSDRDRRWGGIVLDFRSSVPVSEPCHARIGGKHLLGKASFPVAIGVAKCESCETWNEAEACMARSELGRGT